MWVKLSHLPVGLGSLDPTTGLGGKVGLGTNGEYLGKRGGGDRKAGLLTITGVCESGGGGEEFGVMKFPLFGVRSPQADGDSGGWLGR